MAEATPRNPVCGSYRGCRFTVHRDDRGRYQVLGRAGTRLFDVVHPDDIPPAFEIVSDCLAAEGKRGLFES